MGKIILFLVCLITVCSAFGENDTSLTSEVGTSSTTPPLVSTPSHSLHTSDLPPSSHEPATTSEVIASSSSESASIPSASPSSSSLPAPSSSPTPSLSSASPNPSFSPTPSNSSTSSHSPATPSNSTASSSYSPENSTSEVPASSSSTFHPHSTPAPPTLPPTPYPNYVHYSITVKNKTCLRMTGSIKFSIMEKSKGKDKSKTFHLPSNATVSGSCASPVNNISSAVLELAFNELTFTWNFDVQKDFSWHSTNMTLFGMVMNSNGKVNVSAVLNNPKNAKNFAASKNHSYSCSTVEEVALSHGVTVVFEKIQVQPYEISKGKFNKADTCPTKSSSSTNDIVPIAVGCALAGLIIIVLIAYLIGRRKTSNRGYEQV